MKKNILFSFLLGLIATVSAYGESSGVFLGNYYLNVDLIVSVAVFMIIFVALTTAMRKNELMHTDGARIFTAIVLSMFSVYGLYKLNLSYEELFINWGILNFLQSYLWIIIIILIAIIWSMFKFRTTLLIIAASFILIAVIGGLSATVYNWTTLLIAGLILVGIYVWIKLKKK